jgi:hypothetical protein
METSASFEACSAPSSYPTLTLREAMQVFEEGYGLQVLLFKNLSFSAACLAGGLVFDLSRRL